MLFYILADNSNIEKLLRDGQERHQLILQQLVSMVSDLSKEKNEVLQLKRLAFFGYTIVFGRFNS